MKTIAHILFAAFILTLGIACTSAKSSMATSNTPNSLSKSEMKAGWKLLFDGKTMNEWKGWKKDRPGTKWVVKDGQMVFDPSIVGTEGDIITKETYENYEFQLEWKISDCGNSGIIFGIIEDDKYDWPWMTGPEMQVLDNKCHPDAKIDTHRAGDLYDMIETNPVTFKGANVWHQVRIKSLNGAMEFWLNGKKVVEFTMHTPEWDAMVANSKFKNMPDFGKTKVGHLGLQDHHDYVAYRNLKIREL